MRLNIRLDLTSEQVRSRVLEGLDMWVRLGLLSEAQVRELAESMSQPLPPASAADPSASQPGNVSSTQRSGLGATIARAFSPDPPEVASAQNTVTQSAQNTAASLTDRATTEPAPSRAPNQVSRSLRSLLDEISVIWLLLLGVFLVIVSSGVLAATRWQSFSAIGQYAILFGYTVAFWFASQWTQRQEKLQATAKMLVLTTLLLLPVNFWMMDALGVLDTTLGKGAGAIAAIVLSGIPLKLLTKKENQLNLIGLSWLHWGWVSSSFLGLVGGWALWPVIATYLGTIGTAANLLYQDRHSAEESDAAVAPVEATGEATLAEATSEAQPDIEPTADDPSAGLKLLSFDVLAVALAVLILLFRSLVITQVPPHQLGLAAGICGWLLAWLNRNKASKEIWQWSGYGLLLLGWGMSVAHQPPWQAIGVSLLALHLLWDQLKRTWQKETVLALIGVAGQAYWLLGAAIPKGTRETVLTQLSSQLSASPIAKSEWTSLGFFPFLLGLLWFAWQFRRWQKPALSQVTENTALALGVCLSLLSMSNDFTRAANLLLSAVLLFVIVRRRPQIKEAMVSLTHLAGLAAIAAWIEYLWPELSLQRWTYIGLGLAIAEFTAHLNLRSHRWRRSTWAGGLGVAALSYVPLYASWDYMYANDANWGLQPFWIGLVVPVLLTVVVNHRRALLPVALAQIMAASLMFQLPLIEDTNSAIASFAIGTLCLFLNSRVWQSPLSALLTVGSGIILATSCFWKVLVLPLTPSIVAYPTGTPMGEARMLIAWALIIWALWLMARTLDRRAGNLPALYQKATDIWGNILMVGLLLWGTLIAALRMLFISSSVDVEFFVNPTTFNNTANYTMVASLLLLAALLESIRHRVADWRYWSTGWAIAITVGLGLSLRDTPIGTIAIAFLALGLMAQIAGDIWMIKRPNSWASWHGIPLVYAALGLFLGHYQFDLIPFETAFQADSGLYTATAGLISMGIGRRKRSLQVLSYVGLVAISVGAYELLIYKLSQASGGQPGDGVTLLAALALSIALIERGSRRWLIRYGRLSPKWLSWITHAHWALGSFWALCATLLGMSEPRGIALWTGISLLLATYALVAGNRRWTPQPFPLSHTAWTALGLLQALLCVTYTRFTWFPDRSGLFMWSGLLASMIGWGLYALPWTRWGWPARPGKQLGLALPLLTLSITLEFINTQSLLIVGAFYAWMAKQTGRIRLTYFSVLLFDWALLRYLDNRLGVINELWISLIFGLSVLYVVQLDPWLKEHSRRQQRHWLRIMALGLIGLTALYQADVSEPMLAYAALTLALSGAAIFAGLIFKVRAYLYIGTVTFVLQVIRVLALAIGNHASLLWAVGIALGLLFIWVAATFESRRSQVISLLESWNAALKTWD